jgi:sulfatase modifying factor 1
MKKVLPLLCLALVVMAANAQKKARPQVKRAPIDTTKFVFVQGGTFKMGTDKVVEKHEAPPHDVTLNSFYILKTEVTFEDFDKFSGDTKRDSAKSGDWGRGKQPVFMVSWLDAVAYCNWLSGKEKLSKCYIINGNDVKMVDTAKGYRLPTEAEWEYAARGGVKGKGSAYAGSDAIDEVAWYSANAEGRTHPVAQKKPNELGLFDMDGNVWEWVWDIYDGGYYAKSPGNNPTGPESGPYRVMRGGAWYNKSDYAKVYTRQNSGPGFKQNSVGFRIARSFY